LNVELLTVARFQQRQDAKAQSIRSNNIETRNPKFETISNDPKRKHEIRSTKLETNSK